MAASQQTEIERKYEVDPEARVPDLTAVEGVAAIETHEPFTLTAVYFDTDTLDLAAHSISLRRRAGGGDEGWHIKKPVEEGRTELHWPLATGAAPAAKKKGKGGTSQEVPETVPDEVLEPVRAIVRDRPVTPIARLTTTRTTVHLMNGQGEAVAELADDHVEASDVRAGEFRSWREWEVEFLAAAPETREERTAFLDEVERVLATVGAHPSESTSKLAQTLGAHSLTEARAGAGEHAADAEVEADAGSAASVIVPALRHQAGSLLAADPKVRADEPDAVHQMRRTVRKLRSLLATYRDLFEPEPVDRLRGDLKRLGSALGEARDAEVRRDRAAKLLDGLSSQDPFVRQRLVGGDQQEYDEALARLRQVLTGENYYRLLDVLDEFVAAPPLTERATKPADRVITKTLNKQVKRMRKRVDAVREAGGGDHGSADAATYDAALHEVRKAARRLRYGVTALAVPGGYRAPKKFRRIASAVKPVEKALGRHQDRVLFSEQVRVAAQRAHAQGEDTFLYGVLSETAGEPGADAASGGLDAAAAGEDAVLTELDTTLRSIEKQARKL